MTKNTVDLTPYSTESIHPGFSIDCVILGYNKKKIQVLLFKFKKSNIWQLPGGFMLNEESADEAAARVLQEWTGLNDIYMEQFQLFSDPNRTNIEQTQALFGAGYGGRFLFQRFISLGHYALVKYTDVSLSKQDEVKTKWHDINNLPSLYSDHEHIIKTALKKIKYLARILPIGQELLPEKFTLSELRKIYEIIMEKTYDRRNFHRKVTASGLVTQLNETKTAGTYNAAILYSFSEEKKDETDYSAFI